jgi:LCP family protein required for cell wall assembly
MNSPADSQDEENQIRSTDSDKGWLRFFQSRRSIKLLGLGLLFFFLVCGLIYLLWGRNFWQAPLAVPLNLPTAHETILPRPFGSGTPAATYIPYKTPTPVPNRKPLCGDKAEWMVVLAGLDYEETDPGYLYGLSDVVRLIRVDFTEPRVNMVALPRALLVNIPEDRLLVPGPLLLNQAYFYGARGMGYYTGSGYGAGSLAETIQYNFGITADHYLVVNFQAFIEFIDAIGGIDIDLPTYIDDRPSGYFPPGKQHLNGERTLYLARIREKYSDLVRINDQSLIIQAIFQKLKNPTIIARFPAIYSSLKDSVFTDASPQQIETALCLFSKMKKSDLHLFDPDWDIMVDEREYIPTLKLNMEILRWDQKFMDWLYESLWSVKK